MFIKIRTENMFGCVLLLVLCIFTGSSNLFSATTGKIAGRVIDVETDNPMPGVNVIITGTQMGAATNADGFFYIINVPPGVYSVRTSMMGYSTVTQTNVRVNVDRTTSIDFEISPEVLDLGEGVVIVSERPVVELDVASSTNFVNPEEIATLPKSQIVESLDLFPGIELSNSEELNVRGGGTGQISFQVDGFERTDALNQLAYTTSLNSANIEEIQILTGVFNAEYGNARSGVFNIITKEGGSEYSGSIDARTSPAQRKHFGPDAYGNDQYDYWLYNRPESMNEIKNVEGNVLWHGWEQEAINRNSYFWKGKNDWTAEELQEIWRFRHRPWDYADKPDFYLDTGFGGPVPLLNNLSFFAALKYQYELFPLPAAKHHYNNYTADLKLTYRPTSSIKVLLLASYGEVETMANGYNWSASHGLETTSQGGGMPNFHGDEYIVGSAKVAQRGEGEWGLNRFNLWGHVPLDIYNSQFGLNITHSLSPSTYYEIRLNRFRSQNSAEHADESPTDIVKTIGGVGFDDGAYGGWIDSEHVRAEFDLPGIYELGGGGVVHDYSYSIMYKANFDITSQVSTNHQLKSGIEFEYDDINKDYRRYKEYLGSHQEYMQYHEKPYRISGYLQDRMEYGGMIANVGLRLDYFDANGPVWTPEPGVEFTGMWKRGYLERAYETLDDVPTEDAKAYLRFSPRIGISHPIGTTTKFYFNYGHFYSTVPAQYRYGLFMQGSPYGPPGPETDPVHPNYNEATEIRAIPNPDLIPPKTTQFEIGYEQSLKETYTFRATAYAKDNSAQINDVTLRNFGGFTMAHGYAMPGGELSAEANVRSFRNYNYQDIRGIEIRMSKVRGNWFTGWINYDYKVITKGNQGSELIYEDPFLASSTRSAFQQKAEPVPEIQANFSFHTSKEYGPALNNFYPLGELTFNILQTWEKGAKYIYNPENLPIQDVVTVYHWVDRYETSFRLTKSFRLGGLNLQGYMDVNNLFNYQALNRGALSFDEWQQYLEQVVDKLDYEIGDRESMKALTEEWVDVEGNTRAPIAPWRDWLISLYPRSWLFGIRLEF